MNKDPLFCIFFCFYHKNNRDSHCTKLLDEYFLSIFPFYVVLKFVLNVLNFSLPEDTRIWLILLFMYSREFTHRVKSVSMAKFTKQEVESLQQGGNQVKNLLLLMIQPKYHLISDSCDVLWLSEHETFIWRTGTWHGWGYLTAGWYKLSLPS
jgi:hypothetical protein